MFCLNFDLFGFALLLDEYVIVTCGFLIFKILFDQGIWNFTDCNSWRY